MATLVFDDLGTLRAALDAELVPNEVQAQPVEVAIADDGRVQIQTDAELGRAERKRLREAGVELPRRHVNAGQALSCWAEILPPTPASEPTPPLGEVLFVSEGDDGFLRLSGELLRLGSEDQRLAFFEDEQGVRRNLCRVPAPPYYAVLRAYDPDDPLRAFVPVRPGGRVWIEIGATHAQAARIEAEPGQLILIPRAPGRGKRAPWLRVPDGPWIDLAAVSHVALPPMHTWTASKPSARLEVRLSLVRAPHKSPPDLWVVRERALEQIEDMVRTLPEDILVRLSFAVVEQPDELRGGTNTIVVLRARRAAGGPPALQLDAEAYAPATQVPDLYLPVGTVIDPPLRPSRLRELLGNDAQRLVWLAPSGEAGRRGRGFVRESLPESAFVRLSEWVDYLVGAHEQQLEPWVRSAMFDFDRFVSIGVEWEDGAAPKPERKSDRKPQPERGRDRGEMADALIDVGGGGLEDHAAPAVATPVVPVLAPVELPRSAVEQRLAALERSFCELDTPLDDPARLPMWAELGNLQAAMYRSREAGLCWSRALWERGSGLPPIDLARRWVESECTMLGYPAGEHLLGIVDVVESDLDEQMVRALAAEVVFVELCGRQSGSHPPRDAVPQIGPELSARLQRFFAAHGMLLDLRTLWLARSALARLAGDDRLALFQTRDLIMASLREGVGLARNVPTFVRTHGTDGDAADLGVLADELERIRNVFLQTKRTRSSIELTHTATARTDAYVRLVFAWGFARVGRSQVAREELATAEKLLGTVVASPGGDALHIAGYLAYRARIEQALEGLPPGAPMATAADGPIAARERLARFERYKYERLVQHSRIIDPRQDVDPFANWSQRDAEPFAGLALLTQPEALAALFDRMLLALPGYGPERVTADLDDIFEYLEALPEPLALPRLRAALKFVGAVPLEHRTRLLRNALLLAGYYDRAELVGEVLAVLAASDAELTAQHPARYAELLTRCAPVLRRSNFESQLGALLTKLEEQVAADAELRGVVARLHIAGAFASLGQPGRVQAAFAAAHALLPELNNPTDIQVLLREIAVALSRSTPGQAIAGARALLERLSATSDNMSTNSHYCLAVIQLMEAVVISLANEDLMLSEWARRWVEEDEHLLHRRIHRDLSVSSA